MKKAIVKSTPKLLACTVLVALPVTSFAEEANDVKLSWQAWGRGIFSPLVSYDDGENKDVVPRDDASWGWASRLGFTLKGESKNVGIRLDMKVDEGVLENVQDEQKIWVKPFDSFTVELGPNVFYDTLRGNSAYGAWNWLRFDEMVGEDDIFQRPQAGKGDGRFERDENTANTAEIKGGSIIHYDQGGFHAFASWNILENDGPQEEDDLYTTSTMLERGQYGVGSVIDDLGLFRIQYVGKKSGFDAGDSYGVINAALKIDQAIENLYLDTGIFIPTDNDEENLIFALYGNYRMGTVTPHAVINLEFDKEDADGDEGLAIKLGVGADVDLGDGLTIVTDFRYHNDVALANEDGQVAALVGIKKGFSNGVIGIGFQATTHRFEGPESQTVKADPGDVAWAVPVSLEYWF